MAGSVLVHGHVVATKHRRLFIWGLDLMSQEYCNSKSTLRESKKAKIDSRAYDRITSECNMCPHTVIWRKHREHMAHANQLPWSLEFKWINCICCLRHHHRCIEPPSRTTVLAPIFIRTWPHDTARNRPSLTTRLAAGESLGTAHPGMTSCVETPHECWRRARETHGQYPVQNRAA